MAARRKVCIPAGRAMPRAIRVLQVSCATACPGRSAARSSSRSGALQSRGPSCIEPFGRRGSRFCEAAWRMPHRARERSTHPHKIPLADLDAVVAQNAVRGGGVEVKVREHKVAEELLAFQRHRAVRTCGKFDVAVFRALELLGL